MERENILSWSSSPEEYLGKKLKEIRDGKFREGPERVVLYDAEGVSDEGQEDTERGDSKPKDGVPTGDVEQRPSGGS